ncbi:outer membrane beta-barrel family protein [Pontibacter cellulosilyticus]|uniref:TonB-dependent receptor n=1 Tax=Pontibacter cellulosilyticus TaxID=1720253 RepID=A0A923N459_9BACT|nr:outer membrane beta-barrel family protein [Pontibacter cellulosilyticus]MBC5991908.1 TonB-dependent receptor [Pontibacter cellulosilyticus]
MKKRLLFLLGLLCLLLITSVAILAQDTPSPAGAQGTGKITGVLTDSLTGKPLEYATVALLSNGSTQATDGTLSGENGRFAFTNVAYGSYEITFSFIGYNTKTVKQISVTAAKPDVALGTIKLGMASTNLKEVKVETLRPTITQEADKMVVSIEGTALAAGRTAFDVLATSPGVFVDHDGNIQLNGRAGVTVMLDGKLTYLSARDLRNLLEGMAAENIKNIEIITNPSAKYDAEGSSGILNINLKKNTVQGMNGSAYAGGSYNGKQYGYSAGGNLSYKKGPWNSFVIMDVARRVGGREATFTRVFKGAEEDVYFDQVATGNFVAQGPPSVRAGTDYSFNDKHSVGGMAYYVTNYLESDFLTDTYIGNAPNQPNLYVEANNYNNNRFRNFTSNLHYLGKLDTLGTTLSADIDFVKIRNKGEANFYNYYTDLTSENPIVQDFLYTNTPNGFDIYAAKVDFATTLAKGRKLELGAKASRVISDNDSRFYFNNSEVPILDTRRTNYFVYDENIYAAYANLKGNIGKQLSVQVGLRAEQTVSEGELRTTGQKNDRSYLDFFPSLFVQQEVNENYQINYNYSRRIQRPNYGNLNPFFSYRDPYTYWQGNPNLRSQYTHSIGVTQVFKKTYNLVLNYQLNKDVIAELPAIDPATATTIYYIGNVDDSKSMSLTGIVPVKIMKKWDSNNTILLSYSEFNMVVNNEPVLNEQFFYMFQSNQNIALPKNFKLELNGTYYGPSAYALYEVEPRWWVNLGIKKSFMEDKLDLSLNFNDIFKTQRIVLAAKVGEGNINDFDQYFRQRSVNATLRYRFSKGAKVDERRRTNLEELNRTGN